MWLEILLFIFSICIADYLWKRRLNEKLPKVAGPLNLPIIGSVWVYFRVGPDDLLQLSEDLKRRYGRVIKFWIVHIYGVFVSDLKYIQAILSHPLEIKKNRMYGLLTEWLGNGLLVSYGPKWLGRRRVITPTFHFAILEEFVKIFDRQARILVGKLQKQADGRQAFDVHDYVALATLDVICETAMGVQISAQTDPNCEYVRLLKEMTSIVIKRYATLFYRSDWLFKLLAPNLATRHQQVIRDLHNFTETIIMERRREMLKHKKKIEEISPDKEDLGIKKRMALLDVLLSSSVDGKPLSNADIREEVDTFMFEGHDTTKSGIGFTLYCIAREPEVQFRLYEEIVETFGEDAQQEMTYQSLMDLKYTEKVIKEGLRMYPPVPFIGRAIMEDCKIEDVCLPKGTSVLIALMTMQNDPKYFDEPHRFLPEREGNDNAFAFVPFSAGPRNCIGQRFAMLEMKAFIARIIQAYELMPLGDAVEPTVSVVLKSKTGWQMGFRPRKETININDIPAGL